MLHLRVPHRPRRTLLISGSNWITWAALVIWWSNASLGAVDQAATTPRHTTYGSKAGTSLNRNLIIYHRKASIFIFLGLGTSLKRHNMGLRLGSYPSKTVRKKKYPGDVRNNCKAWKFGRLSPARIIFEEIINDYAIGSAVAISKEYLVEVKFVQIKA